MRLKLGHVLLLVSVAGVIPACGDGDGRSDGAGPQEPPQEQGSSLRDLAAAFQEANLKDVEPLESLQTAYNEAAVVGAGHIVDVRSGFAYLVHDPSPQEGDEVLDRTVLIALEPTRIEKGAEQLGQSGEVLIAQYYASELEDLSSKLPGSTGDEVAFFLTPVSFDEGAIVDAESGRAADDPAFWPVHASAILGFDSANGTAFPLFTDELLSYEAPNTAPLVNLGLAVTSFTVALE
jgi:hypothetical protein